MQAEPQRDTADDVNDKRWRARLLRFCQRWFILFSLYTLSIGPMFWTWYEAKYLDGSFWVAAFYEPLLILADLIPPFGDWLNWYIELW